MDIYGLMKMGLDATELRNRTIANNIVNIIPRIIKESMLLLRTV